MKVDRFEDLRIWKHARVQAGEVYRVLSCSELGSRDFGFRDQIQRAAVSVMNNIAEGFERRSDKVFAHCLNLSKGSNGEVRSMLYLAEDLKYLSPETANAMRASSESLSGAIETLRQFLKNED